MARPVIADLYREQITLPIAFAAAQEHLERPEKPLERLVRQRAVATLRREKMVAKMIDRIQDLLGSPESAGGS